MISTTRIVSITSYLGQWNWDSWHRESEDPCKRKVAIAQFMRVVSGAQGFKSVIETFFRRHSTLILFAWIDMRYSNGTHRCWLFIRLTDWGNKKGENIEISCYLSLSKPGTILYTSLELRYLRINVDIAWWLAIYKWKGSNFGSFQRFKFGDKY